MLTTRDLAKQLGTTRQRVRQLAEAGELHGEKDEFGRWRFPETDVEAFEANRKGR